MILGIANGGITIADLLAGYLSQIEETAVNCGVLNVSSFRDDVDVDSLPPEKASRLIENPTDIPCEITGRDVVLVDDVLYTGRTVKAAFDALSGFDTTGGPDRQGTQGAADSSRFRRKKHTYLAQRDDQGGLLGGEQASDGREHLRQGR